MLCPWEARSFRVDESVEKVPDFVFFPPEILRSKKSISPNCFGEPMLNAFFDKL